MNPEELQPLLEEAQDRAKTMAIAHSLGDYQTLLSCGASLQARHKTLGLYLAARVWCAYLHQFAPADHRDTTGYPLIHHYATEEPEALHRLTHHLTLHTTEPPGDLTAARTTSNDALPAAQGLLDLCADGTGAIDDRPVTGFLHRARDPARLGALLAHLCHATGRLLINHCLEEELARLTGDPS